MHCCGCCIMFGGAVPVRWGGERYKVCLTSSPATTCIPPMVQTVSPPHDASRKASRVNDNVASRPTRSFKATSNQRHAPVTPARALFVRPLLQAH